MEKYKIKEMYAYVAEEEFGEGLMAFLNSEGIWMPMVGADMDRLEDLTPIAEKISKAVGRPFKILKFSNRSDITKEIVEKFGGK